ncbi:MAG: hypothetical protein N4A31_02900 [Rickettsiales bacterium]|jgi:hypothetical protein|nr:hypothetical protein [Rickettsiales bacterium]
MVDFHKTISYKSFLYNIVFQTGLKLLYSGIITSQTPLMLHKLTMDGGIYLLNYFFGSKTTNNILKHIDISIPLMQYYMFGSNYKTNEFEDLTVTLTAASVVDSTTDVTFINGTTFKTAIKDPIKILCKSILTEESCPFVIRGPGCEFLGVMSANIAVESYNKGSIFVNYTNLVYKTIPDAIAKPSASLVKKSAIKDFNFNYVSAEAIYRILGNNQKIVLDYIINPKNNDNIPSKEYDPQTLIHLFKNLTPANNSYIPFEEEYLISYKDHMLGISEDYPLQINA